MTFFFTSVTQKPSSRLVTVAQVLMMSNFVSKTHIHAILGGPASRVSRLGSKTRRSCHHHACKWGESAALNCLWHAETEAWEIKRRSQDGTRQTWMMKETKQKTESSQRKRVRNLLGGQKQ